MSRYVKFFPKLWNDRSIRALPEDSRFLYIYLSSCPHGNMAGFYHLPLGYAAVDLQWPLDRIENALADCESAKLVKYDHLESVVLIQNFLEYNMLDNPNQAKGAVKCLQELPPTPLFENFKQCAEQYIPTNLLNPFETLWQQYLKPVTVTETVTESVTETITESLKVTEPQTVNETVTQPETVPVKQEIPDTLHSFELISQEELKPQLNDQIPAEFTDFWSFYPRPINKKAASAMWKTRLRENVPPEDMVAAAKHYALYCRKLKTEIRFIKHPATFLGPNRPFEEFVNGPPEDICDGPGSWHNLQELFKKCVKEEQHDEKIGSR